MKRYISSPYNVNKLFQSEFEKSLDESVLGHFNSMYSKVRFDMIEDKEINKLLDSLFDSISLDNCEAEMFLFIEELKFYCHEILNNDLKLLRLNIKYKNQFFNNTHKKILEALQKKNCSVIQLSSNSVSEILQLSQSHLKVFDDKRKNLKNSREDLSINSGLTIRKICKILNREFKKEGVLDAMSSYIGFPVKVGGCSLELSVSEATWHDVTYYKGSNAKTKYFHHDESTIDPKAIIYLSDVDENKGPVSYLDETGIDLKITGIQHLIGKAILMVGRYSTSKLYDYYNIQGKRPFENEKLRSHFSKLPNQMKHNSHFGWDIVIDSEDEKLLLSHEEKVIGPKGTCFLFDGSRLLHRGGIVKNNERISLQIIFKHSQELLFFRRVLTKLKSYLNLL